MRLSTAVRIVNPVNRVQLPMPSPDAFQEFKAEIRDDVGLPTPAMLRGRLTLLQVAHLQACAVVSALRVGASTDGMWCGFSVSQAQRPLDRLQVQQLDIASVPQLGGMGERTVKDASLPVPFSPG